MFGQAEKWVLGQHALKVLLPCDVSLFTFTFGSPCIKTVVKSFSLVSAVFN